MPKLNYAICCEAKANKTINFRYILSLLFRERYIYVRVTKLICEGQKTARRENLTFGECAY